MRTSARAPRDRLAWSRAPGRHPAPVHDGSTAVWHLADVLAWLEAKGTYPLDVPLVDVANTTMQINLVKEASKIKPRIRKELAALID